MLTRFPKTIEPSTEKETDALQAGAGKEDACRCKKVSEMKPRQLFGLMISDLAFWKKRKRSGPGSTS